MDTFFSLRFFVAPVLSLIFIFAASPSLLNEGFTWASGTNTWLEVSIIFIIMSGFLVSAMATFLINYFKLDSINFTTDEVAVLEKKYHFMKDDMGDPGIARELAEWLIMEETGSQYVRDQVQARWSLFVVYFTSFLALTLIVLPVIMYEGISPLPLWWFVYVFFVLIFVYNAYTYYHSVNAAVRLMLSRLLN